MTTSEFPHSEIPGSKLTYSSPRHFVVCHVLLHLLMPRHPPYALIHLITIFCYPNLMRSFFSLKSYRYILTRIRIYPTLSSFQRTFSLLERTYILSKLSKTFVTRSTNSFIFFLHRKEVIHPHVLVGIPCYDFTPITCPTLNGPLHCWLGYHIRVLQTFVA